MNWAQAYSQIMSKVIAKKFILSLAGTERKILDSDPGKGLHVQIGQSTSVAIWVSPLMLETCFTALASDSGYDTKFFQRYFPDKYAQHGCYVHAVGQIFVAAGLAYMKNKQYFLKR